MPLTTNDAPLYSSKIAYGDGHQPDQICHMTGTVDCLSAPCIVRDSEDRRVGCQRIRYTHHSQRAPFREVQADSAFLTHVALLDP
jgi:hypothetical protein